MQPKYLQFFKITNTNTHGEHNIVHPALKTQLYQQLVLIDYKYVNP